MTEHSPENDPLECIAMMAESLADPALACFAKGTLPDEASRRAAYVAAVSVGRCRLFGVRTDGELNGALPLAVAIAAAEEVNLHACRELRAGANSLPARLDMAIAVEAEDLCADLLGGCLNVWAAEIALDEAYRAEDDQSSNDVKKLFGALAYLAGELSLVDEALRKVAVELTLAVSGHLFDNWRHNLAPEYAAIAPWWLTGELEQLAARIAERESQPLLDKDAWEIARRVIRQAHAADARQTASDEAAEEVEPAIAAGGEAVESQDQRVDFEEDEMAIAADDSGGGPTSAERRSIQYLTEQLPQIGAFSAHTYGEQIAAGYNNTSGPHKIPFFVMASQLIEPDVQKLIDWMTGELELRRDVAERICVNLGWRW
jgi:hypothetical protein